MRNYLPAIGADNCTRVLRDLHAAQDSWITRAGDGAADFCTLGAATYLDVDSIDDSTDYHARAARQNPVLQADFGWLLEVVRSSIEGYLGMPARFTDEHALPGFHLFFGDAIARPAAAHPHLDRQHTLLEWTGGLDGVPPISFTLPVALPAAGGGIDIWDFAERDIGGYYDDSGYEPVYPEDERTFHPYVLGTLSLIGGNVYHRIGRIDWVRPTDARVTLQGHGVRSQGEWILYW